MNKVSHIRAVGKTNGSPPNLRRPRVHAPRNTNRDGVVLTHDQKPPEHRGQSRIHNGAPPHRWRPLISVFGSSMPHRGDELYATGIRMGELLGGAGFDVMTGGYKGVMEAVSRGARDSGAHVVGVTMKRFADRVNRYVMDEIRTANFYERFGWLVDRADGYIALHGGIGTLAEVTFTWQELVLRMVPKRPFILCGPAWRILHKSWMDGLVPAAHLYDPLTLVDTPEEAVEILRTHFEMDEPIELNAR